MFAKASGVYRPYGRLRHNLSTLTARTPVTRHMGLIQQLSRILEHHNGLAETATPRMNLPAQTEVLITSAGLMLANPLGRRGARTLVIHLGLSRPASV